MSKSFPFLLSYNILSEPPFLAPEPPYKWRLRISVAEPEPPGAATFRVEPKPIFLLAGAESRSRLF